MKKNIVPPKKRRPTVTIDLGPEGLKLLDSCLQMLIGLDYDKRRELGLRGYYRAMTRSTVVRLALVALAKQQGVKVPIAFDIE